MFKVGFIVRPGGEEYDPGVFAVGGRERHQHFSQGDEKRSEAEDVALSESAGQNPREDDAVFQTISCARGGLGAIADDAKLAIRRADQIGGVKMEPGIVGRAQAVDGAEEP